MTKSQRTRPNDAAVSIEDPDETAVRDAVRAVQADLQHLLHQHFTDVKNVLKPLVKECVEQARQESARSALPPQVPMTPQITVAPPQARMMRTAEKTRHEETLEETPDEASEKFKTSVWRVSTTAPIPTYAIVGVITLIFALVGALTWTMMRDTPTPSQTGSQPGAQPSATSAPTQTATAGALLPARAAQANFHRALARWTAGYRAGDLKTAITSHLIPSAGANNGERSNVDEDVVEAAKAYLKDPTLTTHAQEARLAIALAQVAVSQSVGRTLTIDGLITWQRIDEPLGTTAPLISAEFAKTYLTDTLTITDLCGAATGTDCARMIHQVPLALAAERMMLVP